MRIAFVINAMARAGAEIQVKDLAVRLAARGHDVLVISMMPFEAFEEELAAHGVKTRTLSMKKGQGSARALARLIAVLHEFRPDVIHAHMFAAIVAARSARAALEPLRLVSRRAPSPVLVGTAHTPFEASDRRYLAYRVTEPFSDLWTCVCMEGIETHERRKAVPPGSGLLTSNGIDVKSFRPDKALRAAKRRELGYGDAFLWLTAGSFRDEQKDYGNLLRGFQDVHRAHGSARLLIAGEGRLREEKHELARELGISDRVHFLGLRADMTELLNAADGFVLGSAWEALPISLLEAAASGLPIVATDVGQNKDIVVEGAGRIVPAKAHAALGQALVEITELDEAARVAMGERGRAHVSATFDLEVVVDWWLRKYRELISVRGPREVRA